MKACFFDVDGTLLPKFHKQMPDTTKAALQKLKETGCKVILCTGRGISELEFTDFKFDGYILLNGQLCLDEKMEAYYVNPIKGADLAELIRIFEERKIPVVLTEKNRAYMNFHNDYVFSVSKEISLPPHPIEPYTGNDIYMASVYTDGKMSIGNLKTDRWHEWAFDAYSEGGGKHKGLQEFCRKYRIETNDVMAFGDAENDVEMIRKAGIGVAMGNAYDNVKQAADFVTVNAEDDGITKALQHFNLIQMG